MKVRTFARHLRDAIKSLVRNGWMSIASISAVALTLLLVGSFTGILLNVNKLASDVENDVSVKVYIDLATDAANQDTLKAELEKIKDVDSITFSSRDEELDKIIGSYGNEFDLFGGDANPLYDAFVLNTDKPENTKAVAEAAGQLEYVAKVEYGGATADKLFETIATIRTIGLVIIIGLLLVAVFLISNTIRITIFSRSTEIEIMRLVGAKNGYIRGPFLIEGAAIGFIGAVIPTVGLIFVYNFIYDMSGDYLAGTNFGLLTPNPFLIYISLLMMAIGIIIGAFGSVFSMRRFLKV